MIGDAVQVLDRIMTAPPFEPFPKIPRLNREIIVTEKIDGTNASITILEDGRVLAGSRNRYVTPSSDNFGFARWVSEREDALRMTLGVGRHFGEWFGKGIQRGYGLDEKRFALFNTTRWKGEPLPEGVVVVPELYRGVIYDFPYDEVLHLLRTFGSVAVPGFMNPEGIVVFHTAANQLFKVTLENDESPKGMTA